MMITNSILLYASMTTSGGMIFYEFKREFKLNAFIYENTTPYIYLISAHQESGSSTTSSPAPGDAATIRLLHNLQERVRHLQTENISLRKNGRPFAGDRSPQLTQNEVNGRYRNLNLVKRNTILYSYNRII